MGVSEEVETAGKRTRLSAEKRRALLVDLGVEWLASRPLEEITPEGLAEAAGVSSGLMFYYFGTRQGLHAEILHAAAQKLWSAIDPPEKMPPHARIYYMLMTAVNYAAANNALFWAINQSMYSFEPQIRDATLPVREDAIEYVCSALFEMGVPDVPAIRVCVRTWVITVESLLRNQFQLRHKDPRNPENLDTSLISSILEHSLFGMIDTSLTWTRSRANEESVTSHLAATQGA
jgi:AcrR family transcriptional regulator